ncbi:MAG: hypothetical protein DI498_06495 [Paracoccus denitrificans]|nr:MAG: hypothetical protein DI498_06495 [Paracoccus denitrificans]PZO84737.1 MAG: hypothetical protein DI633_06495 [Paracoccus denitrificans]
MVVKSASSSFPDIMRVTLHRPTLEDAGDITNGLSDLDTVRWLSEVPWPYTQADARAFISRFATPQDQVIRADGQFAGMIRGGGSLGYWIAPLMRGQGIALRAGVMALTRYFDQGSGIARASVMTGNAGSTAVLERLGFQDDGPIQIHARALAADVPGRKMVLTRDRFAALHPLTVTTPRLVALPPQPDDLPALRRIVTIPEVARMLFLFAPGMTVADIAPRFAPWQNRRPVRLTIRLGNQIVGSIGVGQGPTPPIYYFIDPAFQRQGILSEILSPFVEEVTARFKLRRLEAEVFADNPASRAVLERAGFRWVRDEVMTSAARTDPSPGWVLTKDT